MSSRSYDTCQNSHEKRPSVQFHEIQFISNSEPRKESTQLNKSVHYIVTQPINIIYFYRTVSALLQYSITLRKKLQTLIK